MGTMQVGTQNAGWKDKLFKPWIVKRQKHSEIFTEIVKSGRKINTHSEDTK
jgi:hypothetical protein